MNNNVQDVRVPGNTGSNDPAQQSASVSFGQVIPTSVPVPPTVQPVSVPPQPLAMPAVQPTPQPSPAPTTQPGFTQTPVPPPDKPTMPHAPKQQLNWRKIGKIAAIIVLILLVLGGIALVAMNLLNRQTEGETPNASRFNTIQIPLEDLAGQDGVALLGTRSLLVNGPLQANSSFTISPSAQPSNASRGQLYFDQNTNQLAYFNGTRFVPVADSTTVVESISGISGQIILGAGLNGANGQITNSGVLTIQGQAGAVTLTGGPGIIVDGTTIINSGVTSLGGQAGDITLGNGLAVGPTGELQNSGIVGATGGTGISVVNDGNGNITISSTGAGTGTVQSPGGTPGRLAKFTGVQTIEDSLLSEAGTVVTVNGNLGVTGALTLGTALTVGNGGTGATSLANNGVVIGQGAGALTAVTAGGPGLCLMSTAGAPVFQACPGGASVTSVNGLTGALTIANATGAGTTITIDDASTAQKGIAQFNATNFTAASGIINTIQDIHVAATPTFGALTLTSSQATSPMLLVNNTNAGGTGNLIDLQLNGSSRMTVSPAGNMTLTGTLNGQTISSAANFTGTLTVANNTTVNGDLGVNGGDITSTGALNITPGGALTVGATLQNLTLQGNGSTTLRATDAGSTTALTFQTPTANVNYRLLTAAAGTYDICTTVGNCAGVGGGVTTPGGTVNQLAKFSGSNSIVDSIISDDGTTATIAGTLAVNTITPGGALTIGAIAQNLTLQGASTSLTATSGGITNTLTFATPSGSGKTITIPNANGTVAVSASGPLVLDADGNLSCPTCSLSGSGVTSLNGLTGSLTLANSNGVGTTITIDDASTAQKGIAQFNATNFTAASGTINTIQNINTAATPTFAGVNTNNITPSGALTIGATGQQFTLQGNASSVINATSGVNTTTLSFQTPTANVNYRFATAAAGNYDVCTTVGNCAGVGGGVTTVGGTPGTIAKFTGTNAIGDSLLTETAGTITVNGDLNLTAGNQFQVNGTQISSADLSNDANLAKLNASQTFTGNSNTFRNGSNSAIAFSVQNAATNRILTIDTTGGEVELGQSSTLGGRLVFNNATNTNTITLVSSVASANRTITLPDDSGTICLSTGNCAGAGVTLQSAYNNSTSPEITLDATRGALTIRDAATPIAANLLEVEDNAGSTTYFAVTASGTSTTGSATATGNINSSGGSLQTGGTTRVDNTGNLVNIGDITSTGIVALQGGTVTIGTSSQAGTLILNDGSSNTGTLQLAALGQNTIYTLPDPGSGTATICLTTGNCAGSGGGITGSGTTNRLSKFTGAGTIGDSSISDDGTTVSTTIDVAVQGGDLTVGSSSQLASLILNDGNGQATTLQAGNSAGNLTFILPSTTGTANQCLKQSGAGNQLVWQDCDGGSGGTSATLQSAYNNGNSITTTDARDVDIVLANTATDANLDIVVADGSTSFVSLSRADGAGTADPAQMLLVDNLDADRALPIGIKVQSAGGGITTGIDLGDADITDAVNIGANNIVGTTGNIDLTNFDVIGSSGNTTVGGTLGVTGTTTLTGDLAANGNTTIGNANTDTLTVTAVLQGASPLVFEGGTADANELTLAVAALTADRTITLPDETGTVCLQSSTNCGFALSSGSTNYIQNQTAVDQTADFRISGTGRVNTALLAPAIRPITDGTTALQLQNAAGSSTALVVDTTNLRVGIGAGTVPSEALDVTGNLVVKDSGNTKSYRFRTSGSELDFESSGAALTVSTWSGAGFTGTQRNYLILEESSHVAQAFGAWQFRTADGATVRHSINGTAAADVSFNQNGEATNFTVQGDTDANLLLVQGSTDRVGIGTAAPNFKLDVNGTFGVTGNSTLAGDLAANGNTTIGNANTDTLTVTSILQGASPLVFEGGTADANELTLAVAALTADRTITLPDETGTVCLRNSTNCGFIAGSGTAFLQGGNSFGAIATLGTNDNFGLNLEVNNTVVASLAAVDGSALFKNHNDSLAAFVVKTEFDDNLFVIDTQNSRVGINLGASNTPILDAPGLQIYGGLRLSGGTLDDAFTSPGGANIGAKINIPHYDPGSGNTMFAAGIQQAVGVSTSSTVIGVFDSRTNANHWPTIAVYSPDESKLMGLTWAGSNSEARVTTHNATGTTGGMALQSGDTAGTGTASGGVAVRSGNGVGGNNSTGAITIDSGTPTGSGTAGNISIGTANAPIISIGNASSETRVFTDLNIRGPGTDSQNGTVTFGNPAAWTPTIKGINDASVSWFGSGFGEDILSLEVAGMQFGTGAGDPSYTLDAFNGRHTFKAQGNFGYLRFLDDTNTEVLYMDEDESTFRPMANADATFRILNSSTDTMFQVDTTNNRIYLGETVADSNGIVTILDTKNTSGDPTATGNVNGAMYYNSNTNVFRCYEASAWHDCAGGTLGYAEVTASQAGITNAAVDLTGLSVTVTVPANHRIRITAQLAMSGNTVGDAPAVRIHESTTQLQECHNRVTVANSGDVIHCSVVLTPSAGSHTYNLKGVIANGAANSAALSASATKPAYILVEDIGK